MRSTLCLATLCFAAVGAEPVELTTKNFDKKVVQGKKSAFVKFLAPWCGHCKKMKPDWDELGEKFENSKTKLIGDVDCTKDESKDLCERFGVKGYPTLKYFTPGDPDGVNYEGERDLKSLTAFVKALGPSCGPNYKKKCTPEELEALDGYLALPAEELEAKIAEVNGLITSEEERHEQVQKELQATYKASMEQLDAAKKKHLPELKLMKASRSKPADAAAAA